MGVNVSEVFGQNVFDESVMKNRLPEATYNEIKKIMHEGGDITMDIANIVAQAMKEWAVEKGATHYTHVFQPYIISVGAEKHDSFASVPVDGKIENSELRGCTKLERVEYIKEIPAPGILIFGTLYVLFLCMGWIKVTDFVLFMISFVIIIMIDRRSTLRRGTKKIKKYIQKFNRE